MCLKVDKEKSKIETTQEDIVVYKVLFKKNDNTAISPYRGFSYELGKEYKTTAAIKMYPSYNASVPLMYEVYEGFHSFLTLEDASNERKICSYSHISACCYKCIIPKGTKVIYGEFYTYDAIVSEAIKVIEELE